MADGVVEAPSFERKREFHYVGGGNEVICRGAGPDRAPQAVRLETFRTRSAHPSCTTEDPLPIRLPGLRPFDVLPGLGQHGPPGDGGFDLTTVRVGQV